jgi:hypothetical protein
MRKIFILLFILFLGYSKTYSQSISCQELFETVLNNYDDIQSVSCYGSKMLAKVDYYTLRNNGFVVAYIKSNDYDFKGRPYIFCGISNVTWIYFKSEAIIEGSWGKSFNKYIMDYKCNCY